MPHCLWFSVCGKDIQLPLLITDGTQKGRIMVIKCDQVIDSGSACVYTD